MGCEEEGAWHDMILSAAPGDPGYSPTVEVFLCGPGVGFDGPYTSAEAVQTGIGLGEIGCGEETAILFAQVVGGPWVNRRAMSFIRIYVIAPSVKHGF